MTEQAKRRQKMIEEARKYATTQLRWKVPVGGQWEWVVKAMADFAIAMLGDTDQS